LPSFSKAHAASRYDQNALVQLVNEEHGQVPASLGLPKRGGDVLATTMPVFHEPKHRLALDDLMNFLARDPMLGFDLLDDRIQPDGSRNLHMG